jgi:Tfp pilus assembly protein FimT
MIDRVPSPIASARGFTVLETLFVVALIAVMGGMAMIVTPAVLARARADGGAANLMARLRTVREQAIAQRRNVRVEFLETNRVRASRLEVPGPDTTVLLDVRLEQNAQFVRFPGVPDTPDFFGAEAAVAFDVATSYTFTSEGTFVDQNGDELNGTVFVGLPNQPQTAQAVTIFGPTAHVRTWRWTGTQWVE